MFFRLGSTSINVEMWNPLHAVAPFALFIFSVPLAIFAVVTTSIGITLLSLRALIVYFQLATALVAATISPPSAKPPLPAIRYTSRFSPEQTSPLRKHSHHGSDGSNASQDTITQTTKAKTLTRRSGSLTALVGTSDITQDFEGVGGWRVTEDDEQEALWMGGTPRRQTPVDGSGRRHQRSLTGGASPSQRWSFSPEAFRMSPVQSRARTPLRFAVDGENGYFPPQPSNSTGKHHNRRKSGSGSSSSGANAVLGMAVKDAGA